MAKLKFTGVQVFQFHDQGKFIKLLPGAVFEVSDERGTKLKKDYPKMFADSKEALGVGKMDAPKPAAPGAGKTPAGNKAASAAGTK